MKQRLLRLVYPYGVERRVLRGPARGMRFVVEPGIALSYGLGADSAAPRFFQRHVRPGMTVFDVGANKGQMTLLFAALVGPTGQVVSIEPAPPEFKSLERNVRVNGLSNVRILQAAASDSERDVFFAYDPEHPTQGKLRDVEVSYVVPRAQPITVRALPLDRIIESNRPPDVLKIDVEGAAAAVLRGAGRILDQYSPCIYLELHGPEEQAGVRDELLARGYLAETLDGERVTDPVAIWHGALWCCKHQEK